MMNKKIITGLLLLSVTQSYALPPLNCFRPYDSNFKPTVYDQKVSVWNVGSFGFGARGGNASGDSVNGMQYLNATESSLAMVKGFAQTTEQSGIAQQFNINDDDGTRGHFKVTGDFAVTAHYTLGLQGFVGKGFWVGAFIPFYHMKLKDVVWTDQTKSVNAADLRAQALLTNNLSANVARMGKNLSLAAWSKSGPGDLTLIGGYRHSIRQYKPWIKNVAFNVRAGMMIPTGVKKDEDKVMFMPFGNDGSVGLLVGAGLDVNYLERVNAGIDVELMHVFNNTRERRIKTDTTQTDFLLLEKTTVQKDPGFYQKFNVYVEPRLFWNVSLLAAYQHTKRGQDRYYVVSNDFSSTVANTANSLKPWSTHNMFLQLKIDTATKNETKFRPQISVFYQHPFNGKHSVQNKLVGLSCTLNF